MVTTLVMTSKRMVIDGMSECVVRYATANRSKLLRFVDKDIGKLGRYAKALGVDDELHRYTEVLL